MGRFIDLTGRTFVDLTVLSREKNNSDGRVMWLCVCVCGNKKIVSGKLLQNGETKSCGKCFSYKKKERESGEFNIYDLTGDFAIGYDHKNNSFIFDIEDYGLIKIFKWIVSDNYVKAYSLGRHNKKMIYLHRTVLGLNDNESNLVIDHINRNPLDNRKINLRFATSSQNLQNQSISIRNSTGIIGVDFMKSRNKYRVRISVNKKNIHLGLFQNFEEAVMSRLKAEKRYFGEYSPQIHLFEEYGIKSL